MLAIDSQRHRARVPPQAGCQRADGDASCSFRQLDTVAGELTDAPKAARRAVIDAGSAPIKDATRRASPAGDDAFEHGADSPGIDCTASATGARMLSRQVMHGHSAMIGRGELPRRMLRLMKCALRFCRGL